jgi:hypothetical protein
LDGLLENEEEDDDDDDDSSDGAERFWTSVAEIEGAHDGMNMNKVKNALSFVRLSASSGERDKRRDRELEKIGGW